MEFTLSPLYDVSSPLLPMKEIKYFRRKEMKRIKANNE